MSLLDLKARATFEASPEVELPRLLDLVGQRLRALDTATQAPIPNGVAFEVGPGLMRWDLWFRPLHPLRGVSRGYVSVVARGADIVIEYGLRMEWSGLLGFALLLSTAGIWMAVREGSVVAPAIWMAGVTGVFALALLVGRAFSAVRFERILENAVAPHARLVGGFRGL